MLYVSGGEDWDNAIVEWIAAKYMATSVGFAFLLPLLCTQNVPVMLWPSIAGKAQLPVMQ